MIKANISLVYVIYLDHVLFSRCEPLVIKPQIRETLGWLVYECEQYITLCWDKDAEPPTLKGGDPKATGLVLLKTDIIEYKKLKVSILPLQETSECHLNSQATIVNTEYALTPIERKTQRKGEQPT